MTHTQWIIPRNIVLDTLIAAQPFGREMPLSVVWEKVVAAWNYRGAPELVPARLGLFESTPVVNDVFVGQVKEGRCEYVRCGRIWAESSMESVAFTTRLTCGLIM